MGSFPIWYDVSYVARLLLLTAYFVFVRKFPNLPVYSFVSHAVAALNPVF